MAQRKINADYLKSYSKIILIQPLKTGEVRQVYTREGKGWRVTHETTTAFHICPYDGIFRSCKDCGALEDDFDVEFCLKKIQVFSAGALCNRINDCLKSGLEVKFEE
jgi:hypothetical protein